MCRETVPEIGGGDWKGLPADSSEVVRWHYQLVGCGCLQLQFLPYYYSDLEPIAGCCRYVPFHRGLQVSIDGHPGDSDVNLETFVLFLSHTLARFYLSVELGFIVCFLHFMHICHAYTLLNSEECALSEERERKRDR